MRIKKILASAIILSIIFNAVTMASGWTQNIAVEFNSINLKVNEKTVYTDNILYNGTTYIPLRATAEMLDCEVGWDGETNTANITQYNEKKHIAFIFSNLFDVDEFNKWLREIHSLADFTFTKAYWNNTFHDSNKTYYQGLTEYFNIVSEAYKKLTEYKDATYIILSEKVKEENMDGLYSKLDEAYGKLCYIYSLIKNLMESSGYICTEQEFVDNMRRLYELCEDIDYYYYAVHSDYLLYLYE